MIYVEQYGAFWRLTEQAWLAACRATVKGEAFDYGDLGVRLKHRPRWVSCGTREYDQHVCYGGWHKKHRLVSPLDWEDEEFAYELGLTKKDGQGC